MTKFPASKKNPLQAKSFPILYIYIVFKIYLEFGERRNPKGAICVPIIIRIQQLFTHDLKINLALKSIVEEIAINNLKNLEILFSTP